MPDMPTILGLDIPNLLPDWHFFRPAGRLIWSTLALLVGIGIVAYVMRKPKPAEPATWAETILGAMFVWALMGLAYGVVPHEWLTFANSYLDWGKNTYVLQQDQWAANLPPFDIPRYVLADTVASLIYVVFGTVNVLMFSQWQKRKVAEPVAEGEEPAPAVPSGPFAFMRRRAARTSAYGRPVTTSE